MPANPENIENRLDLLGMALAEDAPPPDESAPFMAAVRARSRRRTAGRVVMALGGLSLAAAGVALAVILGSPDQIDPVAPAPMDRPLVQRDDRPTLAALNRLALDAGDDVEMPSFPMGTSAGGKGEAPLTPGSVLSGDVRRRILSAW